MLEYGKYCEGEILKLLGKFVKYYGTRIRKLNKTNPVFRFPFIL
jgi:hypothetical protein